MPPTTKQRFSLFAFAILMCAASYAAAQAGSLDPTFGKNGIVATSMRAANAVALQGDGKIVLAGGGIFDDGLADALTRLNTDGSLDTSFGSGGTAYLLPPNTEYVGLGFYAIAIQSNGEIVAAGITQSSLGGYSNFVQVARVESNGSLDTSFGSGGFTATTAIGSTPYDVTGPEDVALALQNNGSILVASSYFNLLARFTTSGQLDTTFGSGGIVNLANPGPNGTSAPTRIAVEASGKILVASGSGGPTPQVQAGTISRYNANGSLDTTFGAAGTAASVASAAALLLQGDGKIVAAGSLTSKLNAPPAGNDVGFGVVRYTASGITDKTFGSGGVAVVDFGTNAPLSGAFAIAIQSNGELVAGGAAAQGALNLSFDSAFGLARFTTTGALDTSFGTGGLVTTTLVSGSSNVYSYVNGLAIQSDGKIVAAGNTSVDQGFGAGTAAYVARYLAQ
jgi:uncharacterized delta-60 repeat protein